MNKINLHVIGSDSFVNFLSELELNYNIIFDSNLVTNKKTDFVRIIFVQDLKLIERNKYLSENIPTIFLLKDKDYFKKNQIRLLQFHVSLVLPIDFLSFIEIINIIITKYNFFKKSKIVFNGYEIDSNQRIIIKNSVKTKLTEKELELILTLNNSNGLNKSFLLKKIWNRSSDLDSHAFETHLHRLRKKINKSFKDNKFIVEKNSQYYLSK
jgi:DNA-binding response OmpR family regulator